MFRKFVIFCLLAKRLRGTDEMASRAIFSKRVVVWRPTIKPNELYICVTKGHMNAVMIDEF